jgi:hypothetical protein
MALLLFNNVSIEIRAQSTRAFIDIPLNRQQIWDQVRRRVEDDVIFSLLEDFLLITFQLHDGLLRRRWMLIYLQLLKLPFQIAIFFLLHLLFSFFSRHLNIINELIVYETMTFGIQIDLQLLFGVGSLVWFLVILYAKMVF